MKQIPLRNKRREIIDHALVDDDVYETVNQFRWYLHKGLNTDYAYGYVGGGRKTQDAPMHRWIWSHYNEWSPGILIDHKDRNGLNNQRDNLRASTHSLNQANRCKQKDALTSQFKGVAFVKATGKWDARVGGAGKQIFIKEFESERDAAMAYDLYAREMYGEHALINFDSIPLDDEVRIRALIAVYKKPDTSCKFLGVYRAKHRDRYTAFYKHDGRTHYIGVYDTPEDAARARDQQVKKLSLNRPLNFP